MQLSGPKLSMAAILLAAAGPPLLAQSGTPDAPARYTYADLADLAESADLVIRAQVRKLIRVEDERAPGLRKGWGRFYIKARTTALVSGSRPVGEDIAYLVDLPLDYRGRPPALKREEVLLFARPVSGGFGEIQLVANDAQIAYDEATEDVVRDILRELLAGDAPARVTGVRELIHVPGNLAGEGETQIFLDTADGSAASITVSHQPGRRPAWGASFSELVADVTNPPQRGTLAWYRLACFLPNNPPARANLSGSPSSRNQALADYRMVLGELGVCRRGRE